MLGEFSHERNASVSHMWHREMCVIAPSHYTHSHGDERRGVPTPIVRLSHSMLQ